MSFVPSAGPVLPSAPSGLGVGGQVVWKPGVPSTADHVATWAEVYAAIQATDGLVAVMVDNSVAAADIPPAATAYELEQRVEFMALVPTFGFVGPPTVVNLLDGAVLRNLLAIQQNVKLLTFQTAAPSLEFNSFASLGIRDGGVLENSGTRPIIDVQPGEAFGLALRSIGTLSGNTPMINLIGASAMAFTAIDGSFIQNDIISGDPASQLFYIGDNTFVPPTLSAFLGSYPFDFRASRAWRDEPSAGSTGNRPAGGAPFGPLTGQMYFDTDIGKPVWWDGAQWVDATGAPA